MNTRKLSRSSSRRRLNLEPTTCVTTKKHNAREKRARKELIQPEDANSTTLVERSCSCSRGRGSPSSRSVEIFDNEDDEEDAIPS